MNEEFDILKISFNYGGNNIVSDDYENMEDVEKYLAKDILSMIKEAIASLRGKDTEYRHINIDIIKFADVKK